jgi:hypothetical protein
MASSNFTVDNTTAQDSVPESVAPDLGNPRRNSSGTFRFLGSLVESTIDFETSSVRNTIFVDGRTGLPVLWSYAGMEANGDQHLSAVALGIHKGMTSNALMQACE